MRIKVVTGLMTAGLALCAQCYSSVATAQQQCTVRYGWSVGASNDDTTVDFALGATQIVDRSNMRYVRNNGNWPVEVRMTGVLVSPFTLQPGDRNPAQGAYQTLPLSAPPELESLRCVTPSYDTASQLIAAFQAAGQPVNAIATGLKDLMGLGGAQVLSALRSANIGINQATSAVRQAFNASGEQVTAWLIESGVPISEIGTALRNAFNASAQQVAQWLDAAGTSRADIARALTSVSQFTSQQVIGALRTVTSATADQVVAVLKQIDRIFTSQSCGPNDCSQPAQWLQAAGFTAEQTLAALRVHFNVTRDRAEQLAQIVFGLAGEAIQQVLALAGYLINESQQQMAQMSANVQMMAAETQTSVAKVQASTIDISYIIHGDYRRCGVAPSGYQGDRLFAGGNPVRLQNTGQAFPLTVSGSNGLIAPGVSLHGFPPGAQVAVIARVPCLQSISHLVLQVTIPDRVQINTTGIGRVEVGGQVGATFPWVVGPIMTLGPSMGGVARGSSRAAAAPAVTLLPGQPVSPFNGTQCVGTGGLQPQVTLDWRADPSAQQLPDGSHEVRYEVQMRNAGMGGICPDDNPQSLADPSTCSYSLQNSLSETFIAAFEASMEWRVRPVLRQASSPWPGQRSVQQGPWSGWQAFTVIPNATQPPLQSAPNDGFQVNFMRGTAAQTVRVEWDDVTCEGASYEVEVGRRQNSTEAPTQSQFFRQVTNQFVDIRIEPGYEYLWRVRRSGSNNWSVYRSVVAY